MPSKYGTILSIEEISGAFQTVFLSHVGSQSSYYVKHLFHYIIHMQLKLLAANKSFQPTAATGRRG